MVMLSPMEPPNEPGFALTRDDVTLTNLLSGASEAWSRDLATWVLAMLLYWLLGFGIPFALNIVWGLLSTIQEANGETSTAFTAVNIIVQILLQIVQWVLSAIFTLGLWAMAVRGLHGQPMSVGVLFSQLSKIWKYVLQSFAVALGAVLILLPLLVIIFLMFVGPVDLDTPMSEIVDDAGVPFAVASLVLLPFYVYIATGIAFMQAELEQTQVPAEKLCFEVTETAAITNLSRAMLLMGKLKEQGCHFALDDFGSGLSSFGYLKTLPVDYLKIDGAFIKDILNDEVDLAMVRSINDVGKVIGKKTIAEFVESEEVLEKLREIGIDYAQGFGVGRPVPLRR